MNDLVAEGIFLLSVFGVVVVMGLIIWKERKKRKDETRQAANKNFNNFSYEKSEGLYLD